VVGLLVAMAACGDDGLPPAPPTISAGPVTIDTRTMTLTLGSSPALVQPQFLSIGTATTVEEAHYYDPRGAGVRGDRRDARDRGARISDRGSDQRGRYQSGSGAGVGWRKNSVHA